QVALESPTLLVGRFDDPCARAPHLGLDGADVREVADDRGDLVASTRRDPGLQLPASTGQVQGEVVRPQKTGVERLAGCPQGARARHGKHRLVQMPAHRNVDVLIAWLGSVW